MRYTKTLCGFTKVFVEAGKSVSVVVPIALRDLARWDTDGAPPPGVDAGGVSGVYVVDGGRYQVAVADCAAAASAIGLQDTFPCAQATARFSVPLSIEF